MFNISFVPALILLASSLIATSAGTKVVSILNNLSVDVPEPGMMMLFGLGVGGLGLWIGNRRKR